MTVTPIEDAAVDAAATFAMGEAFDHACKSLRNLGSACTVREIIAKRIIDAAKNGERDPDLLHEQALIPFGIDDTSMLCRDPAVPAYASVTHAACIESPVRPDPGFLHTWPSSWRPLSL